MIRWITETLGTAAFGDPDITDNVSVVDVRDLVDKQGNVPIVIREKIDQGVAILQQGRPLVVCCDYGISRSNAIAAGVLALTNGISLETAVRQVMQATGEHEIKLEPLRVVRAALHGACHQANAARPRILITGGNGFIGRRLQAALGGTVFSLAPSSRVVDLIAGALELDLTVREHDINCIVHLANPRIYTSNRALGESLTLLRNVLEVCRNNGVRLIYPSGWEIYSGYRTSRLIANESTPGLPKGPYGETKYLCEQLIDLHRDRYGLRCAMLRSSPLYGVGSDRPKFIYNFLAKALRDETIYTHSYINGKPSLDLLCVEDFVAAISGLIHSDFNGTLNIGSGQAACTYDVARWIVERCGSKSEIVVRDIDEYAPNIVMDYGLAKSMFGWEPQVAWRNGLSQVIENHTENNDIEDSNE